MLGRIKVIVARMRFGLFKWRTASSVRVQRISIHISYYIVTILGLLLAAYLYLPSSQDAIAKYKGLDTAFIAMGGMIGTMVALVFSLSILPIQRAVETFSPSISWLYRNDRITQVIYIALSTFCLLPFIMAVDNFVGIRAVKLFPIAIVVVAATFDLLRWHYRRISRMLEPANAIKRLLKRIGGHINKTQKRISVLAKIQWRTLSVEQRGSKQKEDLETALYSVFKRQHDILNRWIGELAEITYKAIARNEMNTAYIAISAIAESGHHYLNSRKDNLIVYPSQAALFQAYETDVAVVLNPIYEHLKNINRNAALTKDETTCINVLRSLSSIASYTATIRARTFPDNSAPITYLPLGYIEECILTAQRNGLDDAVLHGSREILNICQNTPDNVQSHDVYLPAIEDWFKIEIAFLSAGKTAFANEVLINMMSLAHHLLERNHYQFDDVLKEILEKIEVLMPLAVAQEKIYGARIVGAPLSPPYDLTNSISIANLAVQFVSLGRIKRQEDKPRVNPYDDFVHFNEVIHRHFRNIAEKIDLGASSLLWHMIQTLRNIVGKVYFELIKNPISDKISYEEDLAKQIPWYLAFFWVVFSKVATFNVRYAEDACDTLAWVGMLYYNIGYPDVTESCVSNIESINKSFYEKTKSQNPYDIADMMMYIWHIRMLVEGKKNATMTSKIDKSVEQLMDLLPAKRAEVKKTFELRKKQLNEKLIRYEPYYLRDNATSLLKQLLQNRP